MSTGSRADAIHSRPDIDGLRALAVGAVVIFHVVPGVLPGGFLGVDVFFVISGYLISSIILEEIRRGSFTFTGFYMRRARRILPALFVMLLCVSLLAPAFLMADELLAYARSVAASAVFVPNIMFLKEVGYFDAQADTKPLLHLWSLGVEEQFYLAWPAMLLLLARCRRPAVLVGGIVVMGLMSFVAQISVAHYSAAASFYLPFTRFWELLAGAALAAQRHSDAPGDRAAGFAGRLPSGWRNLASVVGMLLMVGGMASARGTESAAVVGIAPTFGAAMFIWAGSGALLNRTIFSLRWVVYLGLISYPLYLFHWPLLCFVRVLYLDDANADRMLRVVAAAIALIAAIITYRFIEVPVRRRPDLRRIGTRLMVGSFLIAIAALMAVLLLRRPSTQAAQPNAFAWPASWRNDPKCLAEYGQPPAYSVSAFCVRNDYRRPPEIVLLGDSHANALWPGIQLAYGEHSLLQIGGSACPYLRNTEFWAEGVAANRPICPVLIERAYGAIGRQTRVVIVAARIAAYTHASQGPGVGPDYGAHGNFSSADFPGAAPRDIFSRALARDLGWLLESGVEVILVLQVPELNFSPRRCIGKRTVDALLPDALRATCAIPRTLVEARQSADRAMVARVVALLADPDLHVVDPMDALCDTTACYAMRGGQLMYRDEQHLSVVGSQYVWAQIKPQNLRALSR